MFKVFQLNEILSQVLTAARCLLNENFEVINPSWFKVIAGDIFFSPASFRRVDRNISRIFIHPDFNAFTGEHDIAVIRVSYFWYRKTCA